MWEAAKYYLALIVVVTWPPALIFWLLIHPFVRYWRKVGTKLTYSVVISVMVVVAAGLFLIRDFLLAVHFGTNYFLLVLAAAVYAMAVVVYLQRKKHLTFRVLSGLPELDPNRHEQKLLTDGIYARMRNPRYVEVSLGLLAIAFLTNYLATYLLVLVFSLGIYFLVLLEEKELQARFGREYEEYCKRVPRFIPKF